MLANGNGHLNHHPHQNGHAPAVEEDQNSNDAHQAPPRRPRPRRVFSNMGIAQFKDQLRRLKLDAIDDLSRKMDELIDDADFASSEGHVLMKSYCGKQSDTATTSRAKRPRTKGEQLPEKEFLSQDSVLTELFETKHIQTIEHICIASLIVWALSTSIGDYLDKGFVEAVPSLDLFETAFANYHLGLIVWVKMAVLSFMVYPVTLFWYNNRDPSSAVPTSYDRTFLACYGCFQMYLLSLPYRLLFVDERMGAATVTAVSLEQLRLIMKTHSFIREVSKKVLRIAADQYKKDDGDSDNSSLQQFPDSPTSSQLSAAYSARLFPGFSRYLYFMFAPTLVYRDIYPRTEATNWNYVFSNFAQFFGCILYVYYIMERYIWPEFAAYTIESLTFKMLIKATFRCILPGATVLVLTFFGFLHSWLNAWAEMLRFGDRLFYKDWWNAGSYAEYYRTWNCVVHDWLYTYIYKDSQELLNLKNTKFLASLFVFSTSAFFHEYVIIAMLKVFCPVMFVQFGVAGFFLLYFKTHGRVANVIFWTTIIFGLGMNISTYSFEINARRLCPPTFENVYLDAVFPRFWACMRWTAASK